jgi:hypothetical protein
VLVQRFAGFLAPSLTGLVKFGCELVGFRGSRSIGIAFYRTLTAPLCE